MIWVRPTVTKRTRLITMGEAFKEAYRDYPGITLGEVVKYWGSPEALRAGVIPTEVFELVEEEQ